jgi:formylglycine-generating enzyme required for sulfatase activity
VRLDLVRAARGTDGRPFPWGDSFPRRDLCNFDNQVGHPSPIGSYSQGVSPAGMHDAAGNVNNWVADVFWAGFGAWCVSAERLTDPVLDEDLAIDLGQDPARRTDRGGGYLTALSSLEVLSTTHPLGWDPSSRELWHGVRTARAL